MMPSRRLVTMAVALATVAGGALSARAAATSTYTGGCSLAVAAPSSVATGSGAYSGVLVVAATVHSVAVTDNPAAAVITCYVTVNGTPQPTATVTGSGTGLVTNARLVTFMSFSVADDIRLCQSVDYVSDTTPTSTDCDEATTFLVPPPIIKDTRDPIVCELFARASGQWGILRINPQGDIFLGTSPFWDCPPYDLFQPSSEVGVWITQAV